MSEHKGYVELVYRPTNALRVMDQQSRRRYWGYSLNRALLDLEDAGEGGRLQRWHEASTGVGKWVDEAPCVFCLIGMNKAPANIVQEWDETISFVPLNPVVEGHVLVVPKMHVMDFTDIPSVAGTTMQRAGELAARRWPDQQFNLITSKGRDATQSVFHLHVHLVPRTKNDGLALPWYSGRSKS